MRWARNGYRWTWWIGSLLAACGGAADRPAPAPVAKDIPAPPDPRRTVLFVGTSLTAGLGLDPADAYPAQIQLKVDSAGLPFRVVNAGVSGETSAGALRRIDWLLSQGPVAVLVIETGANDGLRGQSIDSLRSNIAAILAKASSATPRPALMVAGMEAMPNLGRSYGDSFRALFPKVASEYGAHYLPFLLNGVAGIDTLNQADGIHPTPRGARIVAANVWKTLRPILDSIKH
ncbi:MAG: arylesterase [Gemmatimonadales bacterium]